MPRTRKPDSLLEAAEKVAAALAGFDYGVDAEDFVLYELHRYIEEDRASFEDSDFRSLIDEGIRAHIEEKFEIRAGLSGILRQIRFEAEARVVALRVIHALENLESDLTNVAAVVRSYTAYLLSRLETLDSSAEDEKIKTAAELLFDAEGDSASAETALGVLCISKSPVAARVLAHAVSEPLLEETLELKACEALISLWPMPRHYMLYNLRGHFHEDIPVRWFGLLVAVDELTVVELVLEEVRAHARSAAHREDLAVLMDLLQNCRDPELEDKILAALNSPSTEKDARTLLQSFIAAHHPVPSQVSAWVDRTHALALNQRYREAASLFERGSVDEALKRIDGILSDHPRYPFAIMLKKCALSR